MEAVIVSIDGPSGTGKSTVARGVARRLRLPYLDTGAFYRAATLLALRNALDISDGHSLVQAVSNSTLDQVEGAMYLDGVDVSIPIRDPDVSNAVSVVSAHPGVRAALVDQQRRWVESKGGSAVVEGRDIGSVVFPDAPIKVYLEASPEVRAKRRSRDTGQEVGIVLGEQNRRDGIDSTRPTSPLLVPTGATVIDTTDLTAEQAIDRIVELASAGSR